MFPAGKNNGFLNNAEEAGPRVQLIGQKFFISVGGNLVLLLIR